jgi:transposase
VRPPTREAEDARRLTREREALLTERIRHTNRIKVSIGLQKGPLIGVQTGSR